MAHPIAVLKKVRYALCPRRPMPTEAYAQSYLIFRSKGYTTTTHSQQSTANSQQSGAVQPESISDISKVRHAHPSIK
jgi:hypothetical protein